MKPANGLHRERLQMRRRFSPLAVLVLTLVGLPHSVLAREYTPKEEDRLGQQAAAEIEKEYKVVDDAGQVKRLDGILKIIAPMTQRPDVVYRAKILQTDDINALSLPGGTIYVTKGLLDAVESDDELAGVLAHEVAHNAHRHALQQLDRMAKMDQKLMLVLLAGVLLGRENVDPGTLVFIGQALKLNALNGYGQKAELEADQSAVEYLIAAKVYNPLGMLSFMEGLQRNEGHRPYVELGIFRTHPPTHERVQAIREQLQKHNIPIVRLPGKSTPIAAARSVTIEGKAIAEVAIKDRVIFQPAADYQGKTPLQRAEESARSISDLFLDYAEERHIRVLHAGSNWIVTYRDTPLLAITPADATFHKTTAEALARQAARTLKAVIWQDFIRYSY